MAHEQAVRKYGEDAPFKLFRKVRYALLLYRGYLMDDISKYGEILQIVSAYGFYFPVKKTSYSHFFRLVCLTANSVCDSIFICKNHSSRIKAAK